MKNLILFVALSFLSMNTVLQAGERQPLRGSTLALKGVLANKNIPGLQLGEIFSMAAVTLATGKIGYDLSRSYCLPAQVAYTVVPAVLTFIVNGVFTERGRFLLAQRALDTDTLNTLENAHHPLLPYLQERLKEAHDTLRPTHWISKTLISPLLNN